MNKEIKGIVRNSRKIGNNYQMNIYTNQGIMKCSSKNPIYDGGVIKAKLINNYGRMEIISYEEISLNEVEDEMKKSIKLRETTPLLKNKTMERMSEKIKEIGLKLKLADMMGRETIIRFNNDADGISSALIMKRIIKGKYFQHNAPIYYNRDAFNDLNLLMNKFKPLIVMLDFASNKESVEALKLLNSAEVEVIIIDHHPPEINVKKYAELINPHEYGGESNMTTGYICYELARLFGVEEEKLMKISLAGDKSEIFPLNEEDKENALAIDYVATYTNYGGKIEFYEDMLKNEGIKKQVILQAKEKLEEIKEHIKKAMKREEINGFNVYFLNLENLSKKAEFPSRSKITSQLYEMTKEEDSIILGLTNRGIIFRISEKAANKGADATNIIRNIKDRYKEHIISGGGHKRAAALILKEEDMLKFIVEEIKKEIKKIERGE